MSRAMKDSGESWVGRIPDDWVVGRAKWYFRQRTSKGSSNLILLAATQKQGMIPQEKLEGVVRVNDQADLNTFKTVKENDFVISLRSFQGGFEISAYNGVCSPAYQVFYATQTICVPFFKYLFKSNGFIEKMNSLTVGIREGKNIQYRDFANSLIPYPSLNEQQRIADFLDVKTQEVDAAIVKTRESIEEYQKLKQAIITHAVTKGIRPNRAMKDCGVEQIRAMPEQWEVFRLKNAFSAHISGAWGNDKNPRETGVVCYRIADFAYDKLRFNDETSRTIRYYQSQEIEKLRLTKGDILIEKSGGGEKTPVGRAVLYDKDDGIALYANFMEKLTVADKVNPDWAVYYLSFLYSSKRVIPHIKQTTGLQNLDLRSFLSEEKMLLPPDGEQEEIVHYLDDKCGAIDALIEKKQQIITELESYKKSLIYEYVTGKKEVPA